MAPLTRRLISLSLPLLLDLLLTLSTNSFSFAQVLPFTPTTVSAPAFARSVNKLYVAGGAKSLGPDVPTNQFMSLDLSIPWDSSTPAWTKLADSPTQRMFPAAFSSDEQTLYVFHIPQSATPFYYNVKNDIWKELWDARFEDTSYEGFQAVTDPGSGLIYIAGGYDSINYNVTSMKKLDIFDPVDLSIIAENLPNPDETFPVRWHYGSVWSKVRNSIIYWGGKTMTDGVSPTYVENGVTELFTKTRTWSTLKTQGTAPEIKYDHCMAIDDNGSKVAIYGGFSRNGTIIGEMWTLDLVTLAWTQGKSGAPRAFTACTIAGDQFLIWGGSTAQTVLAPSDMLIYNLKTNSYVQQYTPPPGYKDLKPPPPLTRTTALWATQSPTGSANAGSGSTNGGSTDPSSLPAGSTATIVGGVVGGLALMSTTVGLLFVRRKRQRQRQLGGPKGGKTKGRSTASKESPSVQSDKGDGETKSEETIRRESQCASIKNNPQAPQCGYSDINRALEEVMERQQELEQKRQLLMLKNHGDKTGSISTAVGSSPQALASTICLDGQSGYFPPPPSISTPILPYSGLTQTGPAYNHVDTLPAGSVMGRPTVQAMPGLVVYESDGGDGYADGHVGARPIDDVRRESDLAQETIEPTYGTSPTVNNAIPDLVYAASPNVGMGWTRQQQSNHPHTLD